MLKKLLEIPLKFLVNFIGIVLGTPNIPFPDAITRLILR
jgi:hypothetical protein